MNHPGREVSDELEWMAALGMEFVDLTLEPPAAASWKLDADAVRKQLQRLGLDVVGHTAWYLPLAHPIDEIRCGAVAELRRCFDVFSRVGARWMNVHPDRHTPWHDRAYCIRRNLESLREAAEYGRGVGVGLMVENLPGEFNSPEQLADLLDPMPDLGLHLDIGHANLQTAHNRTGEILARFGARLCHVHLHDNHGGHADEHLPLGAGTLDLDRHIDALRRSGYDGTITLEVFTPDRHYLEHSARLLRERWNGWG